MREGLFAKLLNSLDVLINPATEDKQDDQIAAVSPYDGATADGTVALAVADTWYAVPASPPAIAYLLCVSIENEAGIIRFSSDNGETPSATNGNKAPSHIAKLMPANRSLYFGSNVGGDDVNFWTEAI